METITTTTTVYTIHELSEGAREYAIDKERKARWQDEHPWASEYRDTLRAFCDWFDVKVEGNRHSYYAEVELRPIAYGYDDMENMQGERLRRWIDAKFGSILSKPKVYGDKYGKGAKRKSRIMREETDCPWTGYCMDETMLDPIRKYLRHGMPKRYTFEDVMNECIDAYNHQIVSDYDYWTSDECIVEEFDINEYRFTEDGERYD